MAHTLAQATLGLTQPVAIEAPKVFLSLSRDENPLFFWFILLIFLGFGLNFLAEVYGQLSYG